MFASERARQLKPSIGIAFSNVLLGAKSDHGNIIPMHDGEFDLPPHPTVIAATRKALRDGKTRYDDVKGLGVLRERICDKLFQDDGVLASPNEILVTNGSSQVIYEIFQTYISPGDRVLLPCPAWPTYEQGVRLAGGTVVNYPCLDSDVDLDKLRQLFKTGVKIFVLNNPHNPTGTVFSRAVIERLIELASEFDAWMMVDEAYDGLIHSDVERVNPIRLLGGHGSRILTTRSFSKSYSMTGFRIGFLYAPAPVVALCAILHEHLTDNVCTFGQHGALAALQLKKSFVNERAAVLEARMDVAFSRVSNILPCSNPKGGFYLFPNLRPILGGRWADSRQFADALLLEEGIATLPGHAFGSPDHLRISVAALQQHDLIPAIDRFCEFVSRNS